MSASVKLLLPSGRSIRSASARRYVLVYDGPKDPQILKRSDDPAKLRKLKRVYRDAVVIDQASGAVVFA